MRRGNSADDSDRSDSDDGFARVMDSMTLDNQRRGRRRRRDSTDEVEQQSPGGVQQEEQEPSEEEAPAASSVRSYTWTGGRTRTNVQLELETLVSTSDAYRPSTEVRVEHQSIAELCRHPRSVAEVGALLSVPIGVARVLLADMAELGLVTVHHTVSDSGSAPHMMLMERVLSGLRRL
ncbi:DUF742 domain-containing protein [Salinifilum ghardaiensis]